jgi:hypothetical protein
MSEFRRHPKDLERGVSCRKHLAHPLVKASKDLSVLQSKTAKTASNLSISLAKIAITRPTIAVTLVIVTSTFAATAVLLRGSWTETISAIGDNESRTVHMSRHRKNFDRASRTPISEAFKGEQVLPNFLNLWEPFHSVEEIPIFLATSSSSISSIEAKLFTCIGETSPAHKLSNGDGADSNGETVTLRKLHSLKEASAYALQGKYRLFAIFQDPRQSIVRLFEDFESETSSSLSGHHTSEGMLSLSEFAQSGTLYIGNYLTRQLVGKEDRTIEISAVDLEDAKSFLRHKVLVGLSNDMHHSLQRFHSFFQRNMQASCFGKSDEASNRVIVSLKDQKVIAEINHLDIELYEYAVTLFQKQSVLFEGVGGTILEASTSLQSKIHS